MVRLAVFWQVGFGDDMNNSGAGGTGTGISGKSVLSANDSGLFEVVLLDGCDLAPRFPPGRLCLGSDNRADAGVDGCCDTPRAASFTGDGA